MMVDPSFRMCFDIGYAKGLSVACFILKNGVVANQMVVSWQIIGAWPITYDKL